MLRAGVPPPSAPAAKEAAQGRQDSQPAASASPGRNGRNALFPILFHFSVCSLSHPLSLHYARKTTSRVTSVTSVTSVTWGRHPKADPKPNPNALFAVHRPLCLFDLGAKPLQGRTEARPRHCRALGRH